MDVASGSQAARGLIVAPLVEAHTDRIVVGERTLFLRDGQNCTYALGTNLEVVYALLNGRAEVDSIAVARPTH